MPLNDVSRVARPLENEPSNVIAFPDPLPVLPLEYPVVFPYILRPLLVTSGQTMLAVEEALSNDGVVFLATQQAGSIEEPGPESLHEIGTTGQIMQTRKHWRAGTQILIQGLARARLRNLSQIKPLLRGRVVRINERLEPQNERETDALARSVKEGLETVVDLGNGLHPDVIAIAAELNHPGRLADLVASNLDLKLIDAQAVLETTQPLERLRKVEDLLAREIESLRPGRSCGGLNYYVALDDPRDEPVKQLFEEHRPKEALEARAIYETWYSWAIRTRLGAHDERQPPRSQAARSPALHGNRQCGVVPEGAPGTER